MKTLMSIVSLFVCVASTASMAAPSVLTPAQQKAVDARVHQYLKDHPKAVFDALVEFRKQSMAQERSEAQQAIVKHAQAIYHSSTSPVLGNPKGPVTVVEFLDYRCGHCREMAPVIEQLVKSDPSVRVVIKELPIFSGESLEAAKMALAADKQAGFKSFHQAVLTTDRPINADTLNALAIQSGLNIKQLKSTMKTPSIQKEIDQNMTLARALKLMGTPAFIIGNPDHPEHSSIVPGAVSLNQLKELIKKAHS